MAELVPLVSRLQHNVKRFSLLIITRHSWWFQGLVFTGIWAIGHEV